MDPTRVTLDEATVAKLTAANGAPVPLCNPAGEVVGYYVSPAQGARLEKQHRELAALWPPEEIARLEEERKNDPRPDIPHEEVIRWFEGQS